MDQKIQLENKKYLKYQHFPQQYTIITNGIIKIKYGPDFPFHSPQVEFDLGKKSEYSDYLCLFDLNKLAFRDIMKEDYHPSLNFAEITERALQFLDKAVMKESSKNEQPMIINWILKVF